MATPEPAPDPPPPTPRSAVRWLLVTSVLEMAVGALSMSLAGVLAGLGALAAEGEVPMGIGYWLLRQGPAAAMLAVGGLGVLGAVFGRERGPAVWVAWLVALVPLLGLIALAADIGRSNVLGVLVGLSRLPVLLLAWMTLQRVRAVTSAREIPG